MPCPTREQLASLSLGVVDQDALAKHVETCDFCAKELASQRDFVDHLTAAHVEIDARHRAARAELLRQLPAVMDRRSPSHWRRWAMGGAAAAAVLLLSFVALAPTRLSAMERMLNAVREVTSYSFKTQNNTNYLAPDGKPERIRREVGFTCWRAPDAANRQWYGDLHSEFKSWKRPAAYREPDDASVERLSLHVVETYPAGKPGIIAVYTAGFYFWVPSIHVDEVPTDNTIAKLRAIQSGQGRLVRNLGTKRIGGRDVRGYVLSFENAAPFRNFGPVEVWVDPHTDLPAEISYRWNKELDKYDDKYRLTDIRWNIDFPFDQFATVAPAGLINATPPSDQQDIDDIVASLRLYAELSGGQYPRVRITVPNKKRDSSQTTDPPNVFDAKLVYNEMLKLVEVADGDVKTGEQLDTKRRQVESARTGLDWLARILSDHFHAGYFGADVTPSDKDKVLLWWSAGTTDNGIYNKNGYYRVVYGDLRTEVVPDEEWARLVPPEVAKLVK